MPLAADYPFLEVLWTMLIFFAWVAWFWLVISIAGDVFRRHDIGGGKKTVWLLFMIFIPFLGVFSYLLANSEGMAQRAAEREMRQYEMWQARMQQREEMPPPQAQQP